MAISNDIIQKLLPLLRPHMEDKKERRGYLNRALLNAAVLNRLDWDMPVDNFITDMVKKLHDFGEITSGKPALCALLIEIRQYVGVDKQGRIDELIVEVQTQAEFLPIQTPPHLLFDLLLQMDFKQQVRLVKTVMTLHRSAAFLVHGEPYCGQQLLVTRLFRLKPQWKNISPIKVDVSHNGVGRSIPHLWRQLTSWFGLQKDAEPNQIIERVCDRLLTQDVIFIFYTVDYMLPKVLGEWLQEFWEPLVEKVKTDCCPTPEGTHLLMFLVDNSGRVCQSNIVLAKQCEQPEYPRIPLHLPPVSPFPPDVLDDWLDMVTGFADVQMPAGLTSQVLLEKSEAGIPEFVYEEICCHCGHNWEGGLAKWLI
ncbi:XRE family transcriptional regulator [Ancylothrix sp. C2]|uniref:XRE family transcriptional regulator n=1 Tax=Ancylothrix sp. D3o TaxID=2953691 RepID=UPI0021BA43B2|nr:XRE family transcriptional regulator [Ancylothrix sp. D3o]MCT7953140.1 XRE family transcriptional regulator [Ancylothrix sp. D3o]